MCDAYNTLGVSEEGAVRALAYVPGGDARDVRQEQFSMVAFDYSGESPNSSYHVSWPHIINVLLKTFPSDEVLRKSHYEVARSTYSDREDEAMFAERLLWAARLCRNVFTKDEIVNFYVQGLRTAVRESVSQQFRQLLRQTRETSR